jgi:hypothetical protein
MKLVHASHPIPYQDLNSLPTFLVKDLFFSVSGLAFFCFRILPLAYTIKLFMPKLLPYYSVLFVFVGKARNLPECSPLWDSMLKLLPSNIRLVLYCLQVLIQSSTL